MIRHTKRAVAWVRGLPLLYSVGGGVLILLFVWWLWPTSVEQKTLTLERKAFVQEVSVSGKVVPAAAVDLGFSQGGRVTGVYVAVGQKVGQGTTLAVVENGDLRATLLQRQAALETERAELASLKVGARPEELAIAEAEVRQDAQALLDEIRDAQRAADGAVRNSVDQFMFSPRTSPTLTFNGVDTSTKASVESKRLAAESMLAAWAAANASLSASSDLDAAAADAQRHLSEISSLLALASTALTQGVPTGSVTQTNLASYSADVASARSNIGTAIAALSAASASLDSSERSLTLKRAGASAQDIAAQEARVKAAEADVAQAQAQLNKTYITAPFSGTITAVSAKVGRTASAASTEISMISAGAFQIESYVPEINIALLAVGDKASVTLDAYGDESFPATVVSIDPAETVRDGVSTYRAMLQFNTSDPRILSGMTASVAIVTDTKADVLSVPQGLVVRREGASYVRVLQADGQVVERAVEVGAVSSLGEVEILSGLSAGEVILADLPN